MLTLVLRKLMKSDLCCAARAWRETERLEWTSEHRLVVAVSLHNCFESVRVCNEECVSHFLVSHLLSTASLEVL